LFQKRQGTDRRRVADNDHPGTPSRSMAASSAFS
jgi:hypothetical protein